MKTIKEIRETLEDCLNTGDTDNDNNEVDLINDGWIEALAYVLNLEICRCEKGIVEEPWQQCKVCLDEGDAEKNRLEG